MKNKFALLICTVVALASCKKSGTTPISTIKNKDFSPLTSIMQSNLTQLGGSAGLLVMDKTGKVLYKQYFGGWDDNTYIAIASGSKWLSAATMMTLTDKGTLQLTDKASKFYPQAFAAADRNTMTLQQLLSHTSGFEDLATTLLNPWLNSSAISLQDASNGIGAGGNINGVYHAAVTTPYGPAGTKFAYGGVDMQVAGGMAELAGGKTWDQLFQQNIASKCNMLNTNYTANGATTNYRIAGGVGTTMPDYANFLLMIINNGIFKGQQVLSSNAVNAMLQDQTNGLPIGYTPYNGDQLRQDYHYGLGCWLEEYTNGQVSAWGSQGAFGFSPWIDKQRGLIGILFVKATLQNVNTTPDASTAPYTQIRNKIAAIADN